MLAKTFKLAKPIFPYNLDIQIFESKKNDADVLIACHGYGHSNKLGNVLASINVITDHIVSFNFPDFDCIKKQTEVSKSVFGTIDEILPLLYLLKLCVIDAQTDRVNLYGFSAGGGAIINALSILNQSTHDESLKAIGIQPEHKKKILSALQNGYIILDSPLKSMEEIIELRGASDDLVMMAARYAKNNMRPIDAINNLKGLTLKILLHFQNPDEITGNRDDQLFFERLKKTNSGITQLVMGNDGGHTAYHASLWRAYKEFIK